MQNSSTFPVRLAYWRDQFTVLSMREVKITQRQTKITQMLLYCRGRHAQAYLRHTDAPTGEVLPRPGDKIMATLQIGSQPSSWRLHIQVIEKI